MANKARNATFNDIKIAHNLEEAGLDRRVAEAIVEALHETIDYLMARMVSREEFVEEFAKLRVEMHRLFRQQFFYTMAGMTALLAIFEFLR